VQHQAKETQQCIALSAIAYCRASAWASIELKPNIYSQQLALWSVRQDKVSYILYRYAIAIQGEGSLEAKGSIQSIRKTNESARDARGPERDPAQTHFIAEIIVNYSHIISVTTVASLDV
jgi:hypothetical protein